MAVFQRHAPLSELERLRLDEIEPAFRNAEYLSRFHAVCQAKLGSFRVIDYLCVHYSAQCRVQYAVTVAAQREIHFDLHSSYLQWLRRWKKRMFDIFRRGRPVHYEWAGSRFTTTVAQINFVHWMLIHGVDEFIKERAALIRTHKARVLSCARKTRTHRRQRIAPAQQIPSLRVTTQATVVALDPEYQP